MNVRIRIFTCGYSACVDSLRSQVNLECRSDNRYEVYKALFMCGQRTDMYKYPFKHMYTFVSVPMCVNSVRSDIWDTCVLVHVWMHSYTLKRISFAQRYTLCVFLFLIMLRLAVCIGPLFFLPQTVHQCKVLLCSFSDA